MAVVPLSLGMPSYSGVCEGTLCEVPSQPIEGNALHVEGLADGAEADVPKI